MKPRLTLSASIFLLATLNLLLLVLVFLVFARFQLHMRFDSMAFGGQDRVISLARQFTLDLEQTPLAMRDDLLRRYSQMYQMSFYLLQQPGTQIAGPAVALPEAVEAEIRKPPPRRRDGPPPSEEGRGREGFDGPPPPRDRDDPRRPGPGPGNEPPVFEVSTNDPAAYWIGARIPLSEPGSEVRTPGVLLLKSGSFIGNPLLFDYKPWLIVTGLVIAVVVLCWLPFIRALTSTVREMSRITEQIAEGRFEHRLEETRRDELGVLASGINRMASRLTGFVQGQKRFLGDIAHELCAPIARTHFALGILEHRTEPGTVDDLRDEVRQMSELVAELLSFSKAGMQVDPKPLVPTDVARVITEAVGREGAPVEVEVEDGLTAMADPDSLLRAISNLVRNAIRYAGDAGPVTITARRDREEVLVTMTDRGPGLPEDEIDRVFTPFYRVETSRNRALGGVGLGLSIVKNCVEACKGTVRCRNRVPSGLEVEIRLAAA
jgi:two-component system sensor histidine kinase CpxA